MSAKKIAVPAIFINVGFAVVDWLVILVGGESAVFATLVAWRNSSIIIPISLVAALAAAGVGKLAGIGKGESEYTRSAVALIFGTTLTATSFGMIFRLSSGQAPSTRIILAVAVWFLAIASCYALSGWLVRIIDNTSPRSSGFAITFLIISLIPLTGLGRQTFFENTSPDNVDRPNILLIVMDTTRVDRLSVFNKKSNFTPNIEKLAESGIAFDNAFSTSDWTIPSHASLFSGYYPSQLYLPQPNGQYWLKAPFATLAERLGDVGYETAGFSGNLVAGPTTNLSQGFEVFWHFGDLISGARPSLTTGFGGGWIHTIDNARQILKYEMYRRRQGSEPNQWEIYDAGAIISAIEDWFSYLRRPEKPFFVFINFNDVHAPYNPPERHALKFLSEEDLRKARERKLHYPVEPAASVSELYSADDLRIINGLYDAEVRALDEQIGELLAMFKSRGLGDNMLFILTSDHGEHLGQHNKIGHGITLHEEVFHIPLIIRPPGFDGNLRVSDPVNLIDVFETVLSAGGATERPEGAPEAIDLLRYAESKKMPPPSNRRVYGEHIDSAPPKGINDLADYGAPKTIRSFDSQLIISPGDATVPVEYYEMRNDRSQLKNLSQIRSERAVAMKSELAEWSASLYSPPETAATAVFNQADYDRQQKQLRDLGYLK